MSLTTKWQNPLWDPNHLNSGNILNYFCDRGNPFYNNLCNNEKAVMQKFAGDITQLIGEEYALIHAQDPILFIICKQRRKSPTSTTMLAYYYIINGEIMQSPDLASVINARLQTSLYHLNESFQTLLQQVQHNPSNGTYSWNDETALKSNKVDSIEDHQRNFGNQFHTTNMQQLMNEWLEYFPISHQPYGVPAMHPPVASSNTGRNVSQTPSVGSCTPRSVAIALSDSGQQQQPPVKKLRM